MFVGKAENKASFIQDNKTNGNAISSSIQADSKETPHKILLNFTLDLGI